MAQYRDVEDLINIGAYKKGSNPRIDYSIEKIESVNRFLKQGVNEKSTLETAAEGMAKIFVEEE